MLNQVIADIEIGPDKIEYYSSVVIRQQFNAHHEFTIRIKYDGFGKNGSFDLNSAQKMIGKTAIIKLKEVDSDDVAYEFHGIVCEITVEQSDNFTSDLVLKGYSPTILLENGPHLLSFYKKKLKDIAQQLTASVTQSNCKVNLAPQYTTPITYICQYRESAFHFLNRLSSDFGEWFYYDGKDLFFGKPSSSPNVDITYGEDVHNIQFTLRMLPMTFSSYSYVSKDDKFISYDAPKNVDGLDEYGSSVLKESNNVFTESVSFPIRPRVESKSDLEGFVKKQKAAMAADLEILTGSSDNPAICIGAIASVKFSSLVDNDFKKEDYGKFLVTAIDHHITDNGKYYNSFEAIPSGAEVIPVKNIIMPIAETQIARVKDNKDPDNMGRVRVQMLWQQSNDEMTDWLRVMTPDAGAGKKNDKNRGYVWIPEVDDEVLVGFRYNDPDRPFVLGSIFHGKTAGGGGDKNKVKTITAFSGSVISMDGDAISIIDATGDNKILFDGKGKIDLISTESITLTCGESSVTLKKDGTIDIKGKNITTNAQEKAKMVSGQASYTADGNAGDAKMEGMKAAVNGSMEVKVSGGAKTEVSASGNVAVKGALITLN